MKLTEFLLLVLGLVIGCTAFPMCTNGEPPLMERNDAFSCDRGCPMGFVCEFQDPDERMERGICCANETALMEIYGDMMRVEPVWTATETPHTTDSSNVHVVSPPGLKPPKGLTFPPPNVEDEDARQYRNPSGITVAPIEKVVVSVGPTPPTPTTTRSFTSKVEISTEESTTLNEKSSEELSSEDIQEETNAVFEVEVTDSKVETERGSEEDDESSESSQESEDTNYDKSVDSDESEEDISEVTTTIPEVTIQLSSNETLPEDENTLKSSEENLESNIVTIYESSPPVDESNTTVLNGTEAAQENSKDVTTTPSPLSETILNSSDSTTVLETTEVAVASTTLPELVDNSLSSQTHSEDISDSSNSTIILEIEMSDSNTLPEEINETSSSMSLPEVDDSSSNSTTPSESTTLPDIVADSFSTTTLPEEVGGTSTSNALPEDVGSTSSSTIMSEDNQDGSNSTTLPEFKEESSMSLAEADLSVSSSSTIDESDAKDPAVEATMLLLGSDKDDNSTVALNEVENILDSQNVTDVSNATDVEEVHGEVQEMYSCERQAYKFSCQLGAIKTQPTLRWAWNEGTNNCEFYPWGYCPGDRVKHSTTIRTKEECLAHCGHKKTESAADSSKLDGQSSMTEESLTYHAKVSFTSPRVSVSLERKKLSNGINEEEVNTDNLLPIITSDPALVHVIAVTDPRSEAKSLINTEEVVEVTTRKPTTKSSKNKEKSVFVAPDIDKSSVLCTETSYRYVCASGMPSQFVYRWQVIDGKCRSFPYGYCWGETNHAHPRSRAECHKYCPVGLPTNYFRVL